MVGNGVCDLSEFKPLWLAVWISVVIVVAFYKHSDRLDRCSKFSQSRFVATA
jgi:hypothetical protein